MSLLAVNKLKDTTYIPEIVSFTQDPTRDGSFFNAYRVYRLSGALKDEPVTQKEGWSYE